MIRVNELLMANYHSDWQFPTVLKNYIKSFRDYNGDFFVQATSIRVAK